MEGNITVGLKDVKQGNAFKNCKIREVTYTLVDINP